MKTKELIVDCRQNRDTHKDSIIRGGDVPIVDSYKCLGTVFDSQEKSDAKTESIITRGQQRIHLIQRLHFFLLCR